MGGGAATVVPRGAEVSAPASGVTTDIQLARGRYEIALRFDVPRAQVIDYAVQCGASTQITGRVGETFDAYRTRRLAELRAQQERERRTAAAVTSTLVGAVAPNVQASGQAVSPAGNATVDAQMSGQAVGDAAGTAVAQQYPVISELAPGDVGAGRVQARVNLATEEDGSCTISALADDATVVAAYQITRIRNLTAEARERAAAAAAGALHVRGQLTAQLEVQGADPHALQRRREAEARARAQAEEARRRAVAEAEAERARIRAEQQAARDRERARLDAERAAYQATLEAEATLKVSIEVRRQQAALQARGMLIAYLAGECHADPHKREREREAARIAEDQRRRKRKLQLDARLELEARIRAERDARDATLRAEREAKLALELEARRAREAEKMRRIQLALGVRAELQAYLVGLGANERPPMPALIAESSGTAPFDGAVWIAGHWQWTGGQWMWVAGGWKDTTTFGASGAVGGAIVTVGAAAASVSVDPPPTSDPSITITPDVPVPQPAVRDHRTSTSTSTGPTVRDHRTGTAPTIRDHRTDDDEKNDSGPKVRDHRTR